MSPNEYRAWKKSLTNTFCKGTGREYKRQSCQFYVDDADGCDLLMRGDMQQMRRSGRCFETLVYTVGTAMRTASDETLVHELDDERVIEALMHASFARTRSIRALVTYAERAAKRVLAGADSRRVCRNCTHYYHPTRFCSHFEERRNVYADAKLCPHFGYATPLPVREERPGTIEAILNQSASTSGSQRASTAALDEIDNIVLLAEMAHRLKARHLAARRQSEARDNYKRQFDLFTAMARNGWDLPTAIDSLKKNHRVPPATYTDDWRSIREFLKDWALYQRAPRRPPRGNL
jgi:hypothetical protein